MKKPMSTLLIFLLLLNLFGADANAASGNPSAQVPFVNYDSVIIGNTNTFINTNDEELYYPHEELVLYPAFEKRRYEKDELITIQFKLSPSVVSVNTTFESEGFTVLRDTIYTFDSDTQNQMYTVFLSYNENTEQPYFKFGVILDNGSINYTEIYGYVSEDGLFLNENSFDSAKDSSYFYLVETGRITYEEYSEILQKEYKQYGSETTGCTPLSDFAYSLPCSEIAAYSNVSENTLDNTTVCGCLTWIDDAGVRHPLQYNRVEICDSLYGGVLGTVYTSTSGEYSFSFSDIYPHRNIYIKVYAGGENANVKNYTGVDYTYTSSTQTNITLGSTININWEIDMTTDLGRAFQISQAINVATRYVKRMNGEYISPITVKYPHQNSDKGCYYSSSNDTIFIKNASSQLGTLQSYASWDVIMHEYGHHIQHEFGISASPGGSHSFNEILADTRNSKSIGIRLAWGEAYPSVFGGMAQAYFSETLQNIATVGDAAYTSYNRATLNYESPAKKGETCEASIIGVLWDIYDDSTTSSEPYDNMSFTHRSYWHLLIGSGAKSFSEFCDYFAERYDTSKELSLGQLLTHFKMSASNLTCNVGNLTPILNWTANGTSSSLQNNRFDLVFYNDVYHNEILRIENINTTSYTLTEAEWNTVLNNYGTTFSVIVIAYQTASPSTGGYYSASLCVAKPTYNENFSIIQSAMNTKRYTEKSIILTPGSYCDFYVTFGTTGTKLIQTFGTKDTSIEFYSTTGDMLVHNTETEDDGFRFNAFLRYEALAGTQYIIRVRLWDSNSFGSIKLAIIPAESSCAPDADAIDCYEDIRAIEGNDSYTWQSYSQLNHVQVLTFTASETGTYKFEITSEFDTFLYVIDPRSSDELIQYIDFDDDSAEGLNAQISRTIDAGIPYLIIISGYNIEDEGHTGLLTLSINLN